jgi:hypothetical protein
MLSGLEDPGDLGDEASDESELPPVMRAMASIAL